MRLVARGSQKFRGPRNSTHIIGCFSVYGKATMEEDPVRRELEEIIASTVPISKCSLLMVYRIRLAFITITRGWKRNYSKVFFNKGTQLLSTL